MPPIQNLLKAGMAVHHRSEAPPRAHATNPGNRLLRPLFLPSPYASVKVIITPINAATRSTTTVSRSALKERQTLPVQPKFVRPQVVHAPFVQAKLVQATFAPVPNVTHGVTMPSVVQGKTSTNVGNQQPKFYPNLNPAAAALKVDRKEIFRLEGSFDESYYRARRGTDHGALVPNSKYVFVRLTSGQVLMHPHYRHPVLAHGQPVLYAGEAYFNNGRLDWWSNGSGNYRPDPDHAAQANLPMERFFKYEEVLKGVHKQTKPNSPSRKDDTRK